MVLDALPGTRVATPAHAAPQLAATQKPLTMAAFPKEPAVAESTISTPIERPGQLQATMNAAGSVAEGSAAAGPSDPGITGVTLEAAESKSLNLRQLS